MYLSKVSITNSVRFKSQALAIPELLGNISSVRKYQSDQVTTARMKILINVASKGNTRYICEKHPHWLQTHGRQTLQKDDNVETYWIRITLVNKKAKETGKPTKFHYSSILHGLLTQCFLILKGTVGLLLFTPYLFKIHTKWL